MFPSPLGYDVKWTSKLIRRDVKNLKTKYLSKLKNKFTKAAKASAPPHAPEEVDTVVVEPESLQRVAKPSTEAQSQVDFTTSYELLETKLKELYASRDRDMPGEERWKYRGSWLLLHMAIQACPSNDSYNVFREGAAAPEDSSMLLELLRFSTVVTSWGLYGAKVSQMPTPPYSKRDSDHARYDSAYSAISFGHLRSNRIARSTTVLPPVQVWYAILEAAADRRVITSVAEDVLAYIWPEKNAADILDQIGHPAKQFREDAELRHKFRELLFPEYDILVQGCC
ncbi:hypothetical protein N0V83_007940 [Neocucurbitaria cava]|uniref:Uncharacterized protein n=1 Tax=Neocucurbitaria cava TaxID=798079 RepID=A0A9W8Y3R8_9PLEO|nr:hypothetical protein N0V83_007940 [Neocucurbitaria cava]